MILCDTNIIIEFYKGNPAIIEKLHEIKLENLSISIITAGELLYGALNKKELRYIQQSISQMELIHISDTIGDCFMELMSKYSLSHKLSLPDGFIAATAISEDIQLYTLNKKDFTFIEDLQLYD